MKLSLVPQTDAHPSEADIPGRVGDRELAGVARAAAAMITERVRRQVFGRHPHLRLPYPLPLPKVEAPRRDVPKAG